MSTSSNESFIVVSKEFKDEEGNAVERKFGPLVSVLQVNYRIWHRLIFINSKIVFDQVSFENVLDRYPLELDLLIRVAFSNTHQEKSDDKIVLVPVAWRNIDDAFCIGVKFNNIVKFPRNYLLYYNFRKLSTSDSVVLFMSVFLRFSR